MQIGILTAPFGNEPVANAIQFAAKAGAEALEITTGRGSGHFDAVTATDADIAVLGKFVADNGLTISSFAHYRQVFSEDPADEAAAAADLKAVIDTAAKLKVGVVCVLAGMPYGGKSKMEIIETRAPEFWPPVLAYARERGIKLAMENWFATLLQGLDTFQRIFEVVPDENFGLNFDPSHLYWQGIDYLAAVEQFAPRIFHTHAKDTEIREHKLRYVGSLASGWWRYVIPGYGGIDWGQYIARLRSNGYNGVLSIEHEDSAVGREEGFIQGIKYLRQFCS